MEFREQLEILQNSVGYLRCAFARAKQWWTTAGDQVMNSVIIALGYYRGISATVTDRLRGNR